MAPGPQRLRQIDAFTRLDAVMRLDAIQDGGSESPSRRAAGIVLRLAKPRAIDEPNS
jgi:hypothetical protein